MKNKAYISLGSNIPSRLQRINAAKKAIQQNCNIEAESYIYETEPLGPGNQAWHLNQVILISTDLEPAELLNEILNIELQLGRKKREKWGAREIDIDILLYNSIVLDTVISRNNTNENIALNIPHPEISNRRFILEPLNDIAEKVVELRTKKTVAQLLAACTDTLQVKKYSPIN
ncbi:MAG: 2-amino-4-hydroxy-6-hydroxymethyldihydropteridine diphosphokinase [bacterium]|nr:2-amino-4-hydroxy-6-hydroxymethyldihydropteridine diphosphokinase [bacterium]